MQKHLIALTKYCTTVCDMACCGLDACDFSPIHIASYCRAQNKNDPLRILRDVVNEAKTLQTNYGSSGASASGIHITEINEEMTGERVDTFVNLIVTQTTVARIFLEQSKTYPYQTELKGRNFVDRNVQINNLKDFIPALDKLLKDQGFPEENYYTIDFVEAMQAWLSDDTNKGEFPPFDELNTKHISWENLYKLLQAAAMYE